MADFDRKLSRRGSKDISAIGKFLKRRGISTDLIISSPALRAQETTEKIADAIAYHNKIYYMKELYLAQAEAIMNLITHQDNDVESLMVVAHNPGITDIANWLGDIAILKMPSGSIVSLTFDTDKWSDIETHKGVVDFFVYPKQFRYALPSELMD